MQSSLCNYEMCLWMHCYMYKKISTSLQDLPDLIAIKDASFSDVDAVFCCLPHGTTQVHSYVF